MARYAGDISASTSAHSSRLRLCKAQGFRTGDNPTEGITKVLAKHRRARRHHPALPYAHTPAFVQALRTADASETVKLAFEFSILCATRTSEALLGTWEEIDLNSNTWTIPAGRMKAGVAHRVPLSQRCVEILERAKTLSDGGHYLFAGRASKKPLSNMVFLMLLRRLGQGALHELLRADLYGFQHTPNQRPDPRHVRERAAALTQNRAA